MKSSKALLVIVLNVLDKGSKSLFKETTIPFLYVVVDRASTHIVLFCLVLYSPKLAHDPLVSC